MFSIDNIGGLLDRLQSRYVSVYQHRCANVRNRNAGCTRCAEACTSGCISMQDNELVISPERCIGCGTCATVCPTCALETHNPSDAALFTRSVEVMRATEGTVTIACKHALDRVEGRADVDKIVSVRCLGRVEESLLIMLASLGAKRIVLVSDACEGCQFNNGRKVAQSVCDTATTLLRAWNNDARISITPKFPTLCKLPGGQDHDVGKRNFFLDVGKNVKDATNTTVGYTLEKTLDLPQPEQVHYVPVMEDGTMPHFIPSRRRHIIEALQSLGTPSEEFLETRLWGHVVIDTDACNSCRMCATFCPTGAITKFDEEDGTCGIEHHPQDCVQCRCCTEICNEGALTVSKEVSAADIVLGGFDRYEMSQLTYQPGQLKSIHERVRSLTGVEEVYDH